MSGKRSGSITAAGMAAAVTATIACVYVWQLQNTVFSSIVAISSTAFWLFSWQLDARLTAKNWQHVMKGGESNKLVNTIARHITHGRAWHTLVLHAGFTVAVACAMAAAVYVAVSPLVTPDSVAAGEEADKGRAPILFFVLASSFLAFFGTGHLDAYLANREFLSSTHSGQNLDRGEIKRE
ncbi:MAG TPA: hypothetical protein VF172_03030 [Nitrososphaera sp.]